MDSVSPPAPHPALSALGLPALALTGALEGLNCVVRFGIGLESARDTAFLAPLTHGIRIHHGYVGAVVLLAGILSRLPRRWRQVVIVCGAALLLSDLAHHFLVLWAVTGSPAFDLTYRAR